MIRLFRVYVPGSTLVLLLLETCVVISAFGFSVYLLGDLDPMDYLLNDLGFVSVAIVSLSFITGLYFQDLYSQIRVKSKLLLAQQLLMVAGTAFLVQAFVSTVAPDSHVPLRVVVLGSLISTVILFAGRLLFSAFAMPGVAGERLLFIGDGPLLDDLAGYLEQHPQLGIQVAGHIRQTDSAEVPLNLEGLIANLHPNGIIVSQPDARLASELLELRFLGYAIEEASGTYAKICNREGLFGISPARLLASREFEPSTRDLFFRAMADKLMAAVCLVVLSPLILLLAVLVKLAFRGPVIESTIHAGRNGVPFSLYRFRVSNQADAAPTGLGRMLIRTGLYALPQFFNVLAGKMSIVGPRAHRVEFIPRLTQYVPFYPHRFKMEPGMTGWSQIQMRHFAVPPDSLVELEYDLYYIKNSAPMMNIFVILQSIKNLMVWGGQP